MGPHLASLGRNHEMIMKSQQNLRHDQKLFVIGWVYVDWNVIFKRLGPHLASLGRNHEMMSAVVLDEGFARKVMIASHDSGGELIASQSNVCCWQLFGSPHVELYIYFPKLLSTQFSLTNWKYVALDILDMLYLQVRQSQNDFFKSMFPTKNKGKWRQQKDISKLAYL